MLPIKKTIIALTLGVSAVAMSACSATYGDNHRFHGDRYDNHRGHHDRYDKRDHRRDGRRHDRRDRDRDHRDWRH